MKNKSFLLVAGAAVAIAALLSFGEASKEKTVQDFSLTNIDGKKISLSAYPAAKGFIVVFTCNHCPFAKLYPGRMNSLSKKYTKLGVPLLAVSSTDTVAYEEDSYANMVRKAKAEKFVFPYLYDPTQAAAKQFGADKTPHAFVIWKESGSWVVKYNGAIDDNGASPADVHNPYVADAIDALLQKKEVAVKFARSLGCQIHYRR